MRQILRAGEIVDDHVPLLFKGFNIRKVGDGRQPQYGDIHSLRIQTPELPFILLNRHGIFGINKDIMEKRYQAQDRSGCLLLQVLNA